MCKAKYYVTQHIIQLLVFVCCVEPVSMDAPETANPTAHTVDISWTAPSQPNGIVVEYKIYENGVYRESVSASFATVWLRASYIYI